MYDDGVHGALDDAPDVPEDDVIYMDQEVSEGANGLGSVHYAADPTVSHMFDVNHTVALDMMPAFEASGLFVGQLAALFASMANGHTGMGA